MAGVAFCITTRQRAAPSWGHARKQRGEHTLTQKKMPHTPLHRSGPRFWDTAVGCAGHSGILGFLQEGNGALQRPSTALLVAIIPVPASPDPSAIGRKLSAPQETGQPSPPPLLPAG